MQCRSLVLALCAALALSGASGQVPVAADNPLLADIAMGVPTVHLLPEASAPAADGNAPAPGVLLGNTARYIRITCRGAGAGQLSVLSNEWNTVWCVRSRLRAHDGCVPYRHVSSDRPCPSQAVARVGV